MIYRNLGLYMLFKYLYIFTLKVGAEAEMKGAQARKAESPQNLDSPGRVYSQSLRDSSANTSMLPFQAPECLGKEDSPANSWMPCARASKRKDSPANICMPCVRALRKKDSPANTWMLSF